MELTCLLPDKIVYLDGHKLSPKLSQKIVNHSPDGFMWGYEGSGPAQLALAVMLAMHGLTTDKEALTKLKRHYQDFKREVIARLPMDKSVALEMDYWAWYSGKKKYRFEVKELDTPTETEHDARSTRCTRGHEDKCAKAKSSNCNCQCGGRNHGGN